MSDILEDLLKIRKQLGKRPPRPVAIWFIDREWAYELLLADLKPCFDWPQMRYLDLLPDYVLTGVRLHNCTSLELEHEVTAYRLGELGDGHSPERINQEVCKRFPFQRSGVWIEMSEGAHILITDESLRARCGLEAK